MPNLDTILSQTMFMFADQANKNQDPGRTGTWAPQAPPAKFSGNPEDRPVWAWRHDAKNLEDLTTPIGIVKDISCFVRSMAHSMPVCPVIEWQDVKIKYIDSKGQALDITLPLQRQFLMRRRSLPEGHIPPSSSGFWQLEANVDASLMLVFGFNVDFNAGTTSPICDPTDLSAPCDAISKPNFMPDRSPGDIADTDVPINSSGVVRIAPVRVVVCVQLICCKERNDFEPAGVLGAGRLYPLTMIMCNVPLESATGGVTITRPAKTPHTEMYEPDLIAPVMNLTDKMTPDIGCAFFTDNNSTGLPVFWDDFFDYYLIDPANGQYLAAVRPASSSARSAPKTKARFGLGQINVGSVNKVPGQAEFDNLHVAPKMVAMSVTESTMKAITMAPFCVHDCLHTHWRWGESTSAKQVFGWDGFTPYSKAGAPLVPPNQKITVDILSPNSFRYTAEIQKADRGVWQIIMHHGSAYAISVTAKGKVAKEAVCSLPPDLGHDWGIFYWKLRFEPSLVGFSATERIDTDPVKIDKFRKL